MALNVGELVARLRTDNSELESGLADGEQAVQGFGEKFGAIMAAAGAAAAVALGAALVGALDQENVGAKVAAQLGKTGDAAAKYGKLAGEVYADNFGESLADVGEALSSVGKSGLVDPNDTDALKAMTEQAMTLSGVFGYDVTESTRAASQMIRNGLAKDATEAFDIIATGAQMGVDKSDDLLDTFNEYSTQFRNIGLDAKTAMGLMNQGLKAGARDSDVVADSLKELSLRMRDGSVASANGFRLLGVNGKQMTQAFAQGGPAAAQAFDLMMSKLNAIQDPVKRNAAALALFGTKAEDMGNAIYALDPSTATQGMENLAGATQRAGDAIGQTASARLETFKRKMQEGFVNVVGTKVVPALEKFASWLQKGGEWIAKNKEGMGPLLVFFGTFAGTILAIVAAMKIWALITAAYTTVQWALNAAMMANPIGLIIIAVIALVAAILWLWFHSASFRDFFIGVWQGIWGVLKAIGAWFAGPFAGFFVAAWNWIVGAAKAVGAWFAGPFADFFVSLWGKVKSVFGAIGDFIAGVFRGAVSAVKGAINSMIGLINGVIRGINGMVSVANKMPGINFPTIPSIPKLARGGTVSPSPGGRPVIMGDGGQVEYGVPYDDMRRIIDSAVRAGAGSSGGTVHVVISGTGLLKGIRQTVRVQGGQAQTVLVGG